MCRFLIVKSKSLFDPIYFLNKFALVCEKSIAPDGELQKDGFGIAWIEEGNWKNVKSLNPIWSEDDLFKKVSETNLLVVHARGAGFEKDRGVIDYNEPFINDNICFVFNGIIRGVKIKRKLDGAIGSQKIFSLIKQELKHSDLNNALDKVKNIMLNNSTKIEGMNIGLVKDNKISALCQYADNQNYYSLHYFQDNNLTIISSESFGDYKWRTFGKGEIKSF